MFPSSAAVSRQLQLDPWLSLFLRPKDSSSYTTRHVRGPRRSFISLLRCASNAGLNVPIGAYHMELVGFEARCNKYDKTLTDFPALLQVCNLVLLTISKDDNQEGDLCTSKPRPINRKSLSIKWQAGRATYLRCRTYIRRLDVSVYDAVGMEVQQCRSHIAGHLIGWGL